MQSERTTRKLIGMFSGFLLAVAAGCGSDPTSSPALAKSDKQSATATAGAPSDSVTAETASAAPNAFEPPAVQDGYTRITAPVMTNLEPGADITACQYVQAALDHDIDVLDVTGYQSLGGHHSVAYATTMDVPLGTSRPCNDDDNLAAGFLGGTGGEASGGVKLPPGVAFRLPKGNGIMLNTHFLNTTDHAIDGHSAVDFKFVEVADRTIASLFTTGNMQFKVGAHAPGDASADCSVPRDMQFILFTNHMHDQGTYAKTELVHADGSVELVHEDPTWRYEMQFNPDYSAWALDKPLAVAKGETFRTQCNWQNTTDGPLAFPREMCFGVGFFLSDGTSSPVCLSGTWIER
jgi:hypothetical protein